MRSRLIEVKYDPYLPVPKIGQGCPSDMPNCLKWCRAYAVDESGIAYLMISNTIERFNQEVREEHRHLMFCLGLLYPTSRFLESDRLIYEEAFQKVEDTDPLKHGARYYILTWIERNLIQLACSGFDHREYLVKHPELIMRQEDPK